MKVAIYARISNGDEPSQEERQLELMRKAVEQGKTELCGEYVDKSTGKQQGRH